jgi:hypothetical protein
MDRTKLKDVLNRLQNWSDDSETLARHLDPPTGNPANPGFVPTPLVLPIRDRKKYPNSDGFPPVEASMARAADLLESFAANNSAILSFLQLATSDPPTADQQIPDITGDQLLGLSTNWILLFGEQLKAMLNLYGDIPGPPPPAPHPGGTSEYRIAAEIVSWLTKISSEMIIFSRSQTVGGLRGVPPANEGPFDPLDVSLSKLEQQFHRISLDYATIANNLPYHFSHGGAKP